MSTFIHLLLHLKVGPPISLELVMENLKLKLCQTDLKVLFGTTQPANGLGQSGFNGLDLLWAWFGWL